MAAAVCFSQAGLADMKDKEEHIRVMRQAADELQESNPELAGKLNGFADKKEEWKEKGKDHMEQKQQDLKTIQQAASALQGENDELAGSLDEIANRWEKKLAEKGDKE